MSFLKNLIARLHLRLSYWIVRLESEILNTSLHMLLLWDMRSSKFVQQLFFNPALPVFIPNINQKCFLSVQLFHIDHQFHDFYFLQLISSENFIPLDHSEIKLIRNALCFYLQGIVFYAYFLLQPSPVAILVTPLNFGTVCLYVCVVCTFYNC